MSVNIVNNDGSLLRVAGGTLYADAPIGAIMSYGGATAPSGWLLCQGQAVSRTDYSDLFNAIGTAYGSGDGSTTFNVPDLREATTKGVGLNGNSNIHYDSDGVALGEFVEDRVQDHKHRTLLYNMNFQVGSENIAPVTETGGSGIGTVGDIVVGRHGDTTEVKAVGVNYIIKAKHTPVPADFMDAVDDLIKDTTVDAVTNGDMNPVTSNAVYDEFKKVKSQTYECSGFIINSIVEAIIGYGRATITLKNGIAEIKFSARINMNNMTSTFNWGLNRDLLKTLLPDIPYITPISNNSNLIFFAPTGAVFIDNMGFGAMASATNQFWTPARMYQTDGSTGIWGSDQFPVNSYITGTVYGVYTV